MALDVGLDVDVLAASAWNAISSVRTSELDWTLTSEEDLTLGEVSVELRGCGSM